MICKEVPVGQIVKGYKATNSDLTCRTYKFTPGQWHKLNNDRPLALCSNGFHFCRLLPDVGEYYSFASKDHIIWEIEAIEVLDGSPEPGEHKSCARYIRLVRIVHRDSLSGFGENNIGVHNHGQYNTGYSNTGDRNSGSHNFGSKNSGGRNKGDLNTGDRNRGDQNASDYNIGDCNSGSYNLGNSNSGSWNVGNCNTGDYNATNFSAGYFCTKEPTVVCFDVDTGLTRDAFNTLHGNAVRGLWSWIESASHSERCGEDYVSSAINASKRVPGATPEKVKRLIEEHRKFYLKHTTFEA